MNKKEQLPQIDPSERSRHDFAVRARSVGIVACGFFSGAALTKAATFAMSEKIEASINSTNTGIVALAGLSVAFAGMGYRFAKNEMRHEYMLGKIHAILYRPNDSHVPQSGSQPGVDPGLGLRDDNTPEQ